MIGCCVDIGSTFTKARVFDLTTGELVARSNAPTTVETDVMTGVTEALGATSYDRNDFDVRLASSSAAGGLRMVVVGFSPRYTLEAGRRAALGAGANVVDDFTWYLDEDELVNIRNHRPDVILLTGGTDGGNERALRRNAETLARLDQPVPVIVAGNVDVREEAAKHLQAAGFEVSLATNVVDETGEGLNVDDARERIREVFMAHIVDAKGIGKVREFTTTGTIMPTPEAVSLGSELLSRGDLDTASPTDEGVWLGDLLTVDVGGATTDVHSIGHGEPSASYVATADDLEEPFRKRTVEGDLGIRYNAPTIRDRVGVEAIIEEVDGGASPGEVESYIRQVHEQTEHIPESDHELRLDAALAAIATRIAAERHAGRVELNVTQQRETFAAAGEAGEVDTVTALAEAGGKQDRLPTKHLQVGKDLSEFQAVVGTGGVLSNNPHAIAVLRQVKKGEVRNTVLLPETPSFFLDDNYVLFAAGMLAETQPTAAHRVLERNLEPIT